MAVCLGQVALGQAWDLGALRKFVSLSDSDWLEVERGGVAARTLSRTDAREVALLAVVRARGNMACFLRQFRDIETFKKSPVVVQVRKFSQPPGDPDLAAVSLTEDDRHALSDCRPGACNVKLPGTAMETLRRAPSKEAAFRQWLLAYLEAYIARGNAVLTEYHNKTEPLRLALEFQAILDAAPSLKSFAPGFYRHLAGYLGGPQPGVEEFFYWSTENFGLKPVTSITHVNIDQQPGRAIVASKQIYANHYYDASLGLTFLVDGNGEAANSLYIVYLNRSRIDLLSGGLGWLRRLFLRGRLLEGTRQNMRDVVGRVNAACGAG
jgi:hypothetical protein